MKLFYRLKNQRAQGPFSIEEMVHWVRTEDLNALDPIFREGDEKWRPLGEFAEFRAVLKEIKTKKEQDSWVLLVKKDPAKRGGYVQRGPFSTSQLKEMLQRGDIFYTDHIWKKGFKEWKKITEIEEFNPPTPEWDLPPPPEVFPPVPVEPSNEELLKKVIKKKPTPLAEPKPQEAEGQDLARPPQVVQAPPTAQQIHITVHQPPAAIVTAEPTAPQKSEPAPEKDTTHVRIRISEDDESSNWWIHLIIVAIVAGFAGYYYVTSSKPAKDEIAKILPTKKAPAPEPVPEPEAKSLVPEPEPTPEPTPSPQPVAVRAPRTLKIEVVQRNSGKIIVKSDASPHFDLKVDLSASFGEVLGKRGESRRRTFERVAFPYELDLGNLVAPGFYNLKLELGEKTYQGQVWVNPTGKDLRTQLKRYIKQNIFGFIAEKRKLVRLLKKWSDAGQPEPFREVADFNNKNRAEAYYLSRFWQDASELAGKPKGAQWNKAVQKLRSEVIYAHPYGAVNSR